MYLKKIKIQGFKSFANKTVLSFPKPEEDRFNIISIVGPNGSGKSNVLDAIQWGLGEQSMKSLRSKKSEDIIFSGSKEKRPKNKAEVTLYFDNQAGKSPIDYKEFTITRTIFRDGTSKYKLNKDEVRLKDILLLLAKTNFGQKSYSIVSQGMVNQVLISSHKERKEFFNEATGVQKYIYKKENALNKIEKSQENLKEAKIALREITPRMRSLTRQIKKLSKKKDIKEKLTNSQIQYYGKNIKTINQKIEQNNNKRQEIAKKQKEVKKTLNNLQDQSKKIVYKKQENKYQDLQNKQQKHLDTKNQLITQRSELKAKIEILKNQLKEKQETNRKENIEITNANKLFKKLKQINNLQKEQIKEIKNIKSLSEIEKIQQISQKVFNKLNSLFDLFKKTNFENKPKNNNKLKKEKINDLKNKLENIDKNIKTVNTNLEQIKKDLNQFNNVEQEKREKLLKWQQDTQKQQAKLNEINNKLNKIDIENTRLKTKKEDLEAEIKNEMGLSLKELLKKDIKNKEINYDHISKLKEKLSIIGGIDPSIEDEYPKVKERYDFLKSQTDDLSKTIKSLLKIVKQLNKKIESTFKQKFSQINTEFNEYFQTIFGGGKAKITFQEKDIEQDKKNNSLISNIEIFASPPDKKIKNIEMLSGGEKALTSLALICAIIAINKPPFVILDEADAALDQKNSARFANILKDLRKHTQFIVITHNQQTIQIADILYGATMKKTGASKLVSLKLEEESI